MPSNAEYAALADRYLCRTYRRSDVAFVRGRGCVLFDAEGVEHLDMVAGIAVCVLGHAHPRLVETIRDQAANLLHTSNLYLVPNQIALARYLVDLSFGTKVFFSNSGTEANEAAIKLARRYAAKVRGEPNRNVIVSFENSFHGRTLGALAATGQTKYHDGFAPLPDGFRRIPYNDIDAADAAIGAETAAVLVEVVQAEGGVRPASDDFLRALRRLCDARGALLIFDEVQTGVGRTGKMWAYEHAGVEPDVMTLAKGLAGGVPIGALVCRDEVARGFEPGSHASTFGGNPLATAAGVAVLKVILEDRLVERAAATGEHLMARLREVAARRPAVRDVRGKGLLVGVEVAGAAKEIVDAMREKHRVLVAAAGENVVRFVPPLIVTKEQVDRAVEALDACLS